MCFLSWPTKKFSLQNWEKIERKKPMKWASKNILKIHFQVSNVLAFYFFPFIFSSFLIDVDFFFPLIFFLCYRRDGFHFSLFIIFFFFSLTFSECEAFFFFFCAHIFIFSLILFCFFLKILLWFVFNTLISVYLYIIFFLK